MHPWKTLRGYYPSLRRLGLTANTPSSGAPNRGAHQMDLGVAQAAIRTLSNRQMLPTLSVIRCWDFNPRDSALESSWWRECALGLRQVGIEIEGPLGDLITSNALVQS
jgi:hypothetical protein